MTNNRVRACTKYRANYMVKMENHDAVSDMGPIRTILRTAWRSGEQMVTNNSDTVLSCGRHREIG